MYVICIFCLLIIDRYHGTFYKLPVIICHISNIDLCVMVLPTHMHTKCFYVLFKAYSIFKFPVSLAVVYKLLCHSTHSTMLN